MDGNARYNTLPGAQLVVELKTMDSVRFPKNYANLLLEIAAREPVSVPQLGEHQVERYDSLSAREKREFMVACVKRIGILLLQFQIFGGVIAAIVGGVVGGVAEGAGVSGAVKVQQSTTVILMFLLTIASYWSFLRWMLRERVSDMEVAIIRSKAPQGSDGLGNPVVDQPSTIR